MDIRQLEAFVYTVKYQSFPWQHKNCIYHNLLSVHTFDRWNRNFTHSY